MASVEVATLPPAVLSEALPLASAPATEAPPVDSPSLPPPPAEQTATESKPVDAAAPATPGETRTMSRNLSLGDLDIPIPSASDISKRKGPTPPPTVPLEVVKESTKHPPGVLSLFVTDQTCKNIGLYNEGAKHESLHLVSAKKIFENIET